MARTKKPSTRASKRPDELFELDGDVNPRHANVEYSDLFPYEVHKSDLKPGMIVQTPTSIYVPDRSLFKRSISTYSWRELQSLYRDKLPETMVVKAWNWNGGRGGDGRLIDAETGREYSYNTTDYPDIFVVVGDRDTNPHVKRSSAGERRGNTHDPKRSAEIFAEAVREASSAIAASGRAAEEGKIPKAIDLMVSAARSLGVAESEREYAAGFVLGPHIEAEYKRLVRSVRYWANSLVSYLGLYCDRDRAEGLSQ